MGDGKSGDCLTGRYGTHSKKVLRQCRSCWTIYDELDNPNVPECQWIRSYQLAFPIALAYADGVLAHSTSYYVPLHSQQSESEDDSDSDRTDSDLVDQHDDSESDIDLEEPVRKRKKPSPNSHNTSKRTGTHQPKNKLTSTNIQTASNPILEKHKLLVHSYVLTELSKRGMTRSGHRASDQLSRDELNVVWDLFKTEYPTPQSARDVLRDMSQHQSILALHEITFGGDSFGVSGSTPTDCMHTVNLGLWKYIASYVILLMGPKSRSELDILAKSSLKPQRQSESKIFP
jgi:hypothetical protein